MDKSRGSSNVISPSTQFGKNSELGFYNVIGFPKVKGLCVKIGRDCKIGNHVTIHVGARIGKGVTIGDHSFIAQNAHIEDSVFINPYSYIGENVVVGNGSLVLYGAKIYENVRIGQNSRIGGFLAENAVIGNCVTVFGEIVHSFRDPTRWIGGEKSPTIQDFVVVGFGATVYGNIRIGHHVYIAAGTIIYKDVPPYSVVTGINQITPFKRWPGRLRQSKFWGWSK